MNFVRIGALSNRGAEVDPKYDRFVSMAWVLGHLMNKTLASYPDCRHLLIIFEANERDQNIMRLAFGPVVSELTGNGYEVDFGYTPRSDSASR